MRDGVRWGEEEGTAQIIIVSIPLHSHSMNPTSCTLLEMVSDPFRHLCISYS